MTFSFRKPVTGAIVAVLVFLPFFQAEARTVVRTGDSVSIAEGQLIEGDFYTAAGKINVSGEIEEDMIAAGGQITINGSVGDNALFLAGQTSVHGTIGDDLRVIGGEVTIAEPVMGDVFIIANSVEILSTASIVGDVLVYANEVTIAGSVGGDVLGSVGELRVDAPITGDIDVRVGQLTLGDRAAVEGSVKYASNEVLTQALNATVSGDTVRNDPVLPGNEVNLRDALIPVLILLFAVLSWYLLSKRTLHLVVTRALTKSPRPVLYGFGVFLFAPVAILILLVSMIGTLVGFIALFSYALILMLALVAVAAVLGQLLMKLFSQSSASISLLSLSVGVIAVGVLMLLPYIGQFVLFGAFIVTIGAILDVVLRPSLK